MIALPEPGTEICNTSPLPFSNLTTYVPSSFGPWMLILSLLHLPQSSLASVYCCRGGVLHLGPARRPTGNDNVRLHRLSASPSAVIIAPAGSIRAFG
jgi:hypothetical protein